MITKNEASLLKNSISLMLRNGRLTAEHLALALVHNSEPGDISAEQAFFGLYLHPAETLNKLYQAKYIDAKFLVNGALFWAKHCVRRNRVTPSERVFAPDFDSLMCAFRKLFRSSEPEKYRAAFVKICGDMLFNGCFFQADRKKQQEQLLGEMLGCVGTKDILKSGIDDFHMTYLLRLKFRGQAFAIKNESSRLTAYLGGKDVWHEKKLKCRIHKIRTENGHILVQCEIGAPVFMLADEEISVVPVINGVREKAVRLYGSCGCYRNYEKTAVFRWFEVSLPAENFRSLRILAEAGGKTVPVECYAYSGVFFAACLNYRGYSLGERRIILKNGELVSAENAFYDDKQDALIKRAGQLKNRRIWLYSDYSSVAADNGYFQFLHDLSQRDGILRFYIYHRNIPRDIPEAEKSRWVKFGSDRHRVLFLAAEKIFAAYVDAPNCILPFTEWEYPLYSGIFRGEIIYLQHGVLHAHIPWRYSPVSTAFHCDKIVVSSYFEIKNFVSTYHFPENSLISSGMPRYDFISREQIKRDRILYAPSWRAYMTDRDLENFRRQVCGLLDSDELENFLSENDLYLDFKPHPMLENKFKGISLKNQRIRLVQEVSAGEYLAFITDFSSYVFDFVFLKTPVVYYFPDLGKFIRGDYQYRELDISFEKGFGRLCLTADETVAGLREIAENGFKMPEEFLLRAEKFFIPLSNCREKLYRLFLENV
ncbi:MAG: CDP-glycerol glycerophosphotransferase family protein [Alistipes sp.]|nr:CDP-glycerol glycerophosphotransferase family protein [Alistipes sp.]